MTSHRSNQKLPNLNGWNQPKPRHSLGYRVRHQTRSVVVSAVAAVLVFAGSAAAATWYDFDHTIDANELTIIPQKSGSTEDTVVDPNAGQVINILVLGQDTRPGEANKALGVPGDSENHQSDTAMVVQISADRSYINLVSIPRDSIVNTPSCKTTKGTVPARYNVMFNSIFASAYAKGGDLASAGSCTMAAVNSLTGLDIQNVIIADFAGMRDMVDALGGVNVCIPVATKDETTGIDLQPGLQHLDGTTATEYARMRHGTGTDGSDIMRTTRQQYLVKEIIKEALSKNLFTQSSQLYQLAKTALSALNISSGLASASTLVGLAMSMKDLDPTHLYMQTIPVTSWSQDINRVVWASNADDVWEKLRKEKPLTQEDSSAASNDSSASDSSSSPSASDDTASDSASASASASPTETVNPTTGLITKADGTLIDPNTGGIVNKKNGTITDPVTGQYLGIADRYLNATVCAVNAEE